MRAGQTRKIATVGALSAAAVVILLLGCALPNGKAGAAALASLSAALSMMAYGYGGGAGCYVVTALLALLLVPEKTIALFYAVLFAPYMMLKLTADQLKAPVSWLVKLAGSGALLGALWLLLSAFMGWERKMLPTAAWFLWPAAVVVYDIALTRLLGMLQRFLRPMLR